MAYEENSESKTMNMNSEIDAIQEDIGFLVMDINKFVNSQQKFENFDKDGLYEYTNDKNTTEKDDGPSEKNMNKEVALKINTGEDLYDSSDELDDAYEVDWSVAGPALQQHIADLEQLQSLNTSTTALIRRLKKLTVKKSMKMLDNVEKDEAA